MMLLPMLLLLVGCEVTGSNALPTVSPVAAAVLATQTATPSSTPLPTPPPPTPTRLTLQFAGDILLHANPVSAAKTGTNTYNFNPIFASVTSYINADASFANMESPVDSFGQNQKISSFPIFNVPYEILPALRNAGFDYLVTANNHAFDRKFDGLSATIDNVKRASLTSIGTYKTRADFNKHTIITVKGVRIGVLAYSDSYNGLENFVPAEKRPFVMRKFSSGNTKDVPAMVTAIQDLRKAGAEFVIVSLHWGNEYANAPTKTQEAIAKALCVGGADIIMGSHSHCVQPMTYVPVTRNGQASRSLIMYSLGNFFADQLLMKPQQLKTQYGMLVTVTLTKQLTGLITIDETDTLPTLSYRQRGQRPATGYTYSLVPLPDALSTSPKLSDAQTWGITARRHVSDIVGQQFLQ